MTRPALYAVALAAVLIGTLVLAMHAHDTGIDW